jgi:hypothetical protein
MTWLILDSGAGGVSLISKDHAKLFGLDPERKEQRLKYEIAPGVTVDSPVVVTDMIMDGNLGQPFMKEYVITFDLAKGRLWLGSQLQNETRQVRRIRPFSLIAASGRDCYA